MPLKGLKWLIPSLKMFVFKVEEHDSFYFGTILKPNVDLALKSS